MSKVSRDEGENLWTPANVITVVRICLVPVFVLALLSPWPQWLGLSWMSVETKSLVAAVVFIVISCTDWVDGYLARKRNEVTDFGKFMDPLADKILVAAALLALVELCVLPSWPVLIILVREFIVSGIRMIAATKGEVIAASWYGKAKTVLQIIAIILFIVKDSLVLPSFSAAVHNPLYVLSWVVMLAALVLTIVSMLDYLSKARHLLGFAPAKNAAVDAQDQSSACSRESVEAEIQHLAEEVVSAATKSGTLIGCAESLTGGMIAAAITAVPGSSAVFRGAVVSYTNEVKSELLGVDEHTLAANGAVSEATAREMACGAKDELGVDITVSVTGIAGPSGGEPGKPVGTVCMASSSGESVVSKTEHFDGDRCMVRLATVRAALAMMLKALSAR